MFHFVKRKCHSNSSVIFSAGVPFPAIPFLLSEHGLPANACVFRLVSFISPHVHKEQRVAEVKGEVQLPQSRKSLTSRSAGDSHV